MTQRVTWRRVYSLEYNLDDIARESTCIRNEVSAFVITRWLIYGVKIHKFREFTFVILTSKCLLVTRNNFYKLCTVTGMPLGMEVKNK